MAAPVQKMKRECVGHMTVDIDYVNREDAIREINARFDEAEARGYKNVTIENIQDDYSDSYSLRLKGDRMETVEEAALREGREAQNRKWQEERDRKEFERLKGKFAS